MVREVVRKMIREELMREALSSKQLKIKALFDKNGGSASEEDVRKLIRSINAGDEWSEMQRKSYVGKKPGEKVWHWV